MHISLAGRALLAGACALAVFVIEERTGHT
jgi:hypothetical protein